MLKRLIAIAFFGFLSSLILLSIPSPQAAMANNERGRKLYVQYCASCHGLDGKGHGPVAESLCKPLPDLTRIEKKGGKFPETRIQLVIAGEVGETELTAHGTSDMPVWGQYFRTVKGDKGVARLNVYALTKYIESIQQP
jgi:mono/diheme cytochrome c family protein